MSTVQTGEHYNDENGELEFGLFPDIPEMTDTQLANCVPSAFLTLQNIRSNGAFYEFDYLREDTTYRNHEGGLPPLTSPYEYREYKARGGTNAGRILTVIHRSKSFDNYERGFLYYTVDYQVSGGFLRVNEGTFKMNLNLRYLLGDRMKSNVYLLDSSVQIMDILALATDRRFTQFVLDGSQITSKEEFIRHFGMVMQPPNVYFNWDLLERQLELTEWLETEAGLIITYKNVERFFKTNREEFDVLTNIFFAVTDFRNKKGLPPLIVFLQGDEPFQTAIPLKLITLPNS